MVGQGGVEVPDHLLVNLFAGGDGRFSLYEDEGNTNFYLDGAYVITEMRQTWQDGQTEFVMGPAEGEKSLLPARRKIDLYFKGFQRAENVAVRINDRPVSGETTYDAVLFTIRVSGLELSPEDTLMVTISSKSASLANRTDARLDQALKLVKHFKMENNAKADLANALPDILIHPEGLARFLPALVDSQAEALFEVICEAGMDLSGATGKPILTVWNRRQDEKITFLKSLQYIHNWWRYRDRQPSESGVLPSLLSFKPEDDFGEGNPWIVQINYYGVYLKKIENK
jgi:hypothetical protein